MTFLSWLQLFLAAMGGSFFIKVLDIFYKEYKHKTEQAKDANHFVDTHLDPLLKSADELEGKLFSLISRDFQAIKNLPFEERNHNNDYVSLFYLLAKFWADIEILRRAGLAVAISKDSRGKQLQSFLECLHHKEIRLVDRITQRAVGEILTKEFNGKLTSISFIEFYELLESDNLVINKWTKEIGDIIFRANHKHNAQRLILYSIIINAMIHTLDPKHDVVKGRAAQVKKLSDKSNKILESKILLDYLTFVEKVEDYSKTGKTRKQLNAFYKKQKKSKLKGGK